MKFTKVLKFGDRGNEVSYLQTKLMEYGFYKGSIDGNFGQMTNFAVLSFQKSIGIKQDGIVGMMTWSNIVNHKNPTYTPEIVKQGFPLKPSIVTPDLTIYDLLLNDDEYIKEETTKDTITLHHTAGGSRPDWVVSGWESDVLRDKEGNIVLGKDGKPKPYRVATSYIIGRRSNTGDDMWDGKILRTFDDKYWAYHMGINDKDFESKSIGIEVCNYGGLTFGKDGRFHNSIGKIIPDSEVIELQKPFRGYKYYERYTDAQLVSLRKLINFLINKHGIDISHQIYDTSWFEFNSTWISNGGLRTHTQVRHDKSDMFPQPELIQMLNSL